MAVYREHYFCATSIVESAATHGLVRARECLFHTSSAFVTSPTWAPFPPWCCPTTATTTTAPCMYLPARDTRHLLFSWQAHRSERDGRHGKRRHRSGPRRRREKHAKGATKGQLLQERGKGGRFQAPLPSRSLARREAFAPPNATAPRTASYLPTEPPVAMVAAKERPARRDWHRWGY